MRVDSTSRAPTGSLGAPSPEATQSDMGPEAFMRLLVTQIRNQDPMKPMDTQAMMQQLTQLSSVERLVAIDGRLQSLQVASAAVANTQATDLVGRVVEADTSHLDLGDLGSASGAYSLDAPAQNVQVTVRDAQGRVVQTLPLGANGAGPHVFTWDGNDDNGQRAAAGRYTITVQATDADGHPISSRMSIRGPVSRVTYEGGYPSLHIGDTAVMMGDVRSIEGPPAPPPPASSTSSSGAAVSSGAAAAAYTAATTASAPITGVVR